MAIIGLFCLPVLFIFPARAGANPSTDIKKVLILFPSEGWSAPAHRIIYNGMKAIFDQSPVHDVVLSGDVLDPSFATGEVEERKLAEFFRTKYALENIDILIPACPTFLEFILRYRDVMFPGIPIVVCAYPAYELDRLDRKNDLTAVAATVDIAGTIDLAERLRPGLKQIAVVAGNGLLDHYLKSLAREVFKKRYQGHLKWLDLTGLPFKEMLVRVSRLPESAAILYLGIDEDGTAREYVPAEAMKIISKAANVPLYNLFDSALGYGSVGGCLTNHEDWGRQTAKLVLRVLSGENASSIEPVVISDNPPIIDRREMKRWGLDESALPAGSIVRFRELSLWEQYQWWLIGTLAFICLQTLLIGSLLYHLAKRKHAEKVLGQSESNLRRAQEIGRIGSLRYDIQEDRVTWSAGAKKIFDLPSDSTLNYQSFMRLIHPDDRERVNAGLQAAREGKPYDQEHRILVGDTVKWVRAKFELEFNKTGKSQTATGILQDITARKNTEEEVSRFRQQLAHVSRVYMVGELSQNLAHEINQPLAAISANAEASKQLLTGKHPDLAEVNEALDDILADNLRAQAVIQRIRHLVKDTPPVYALLDLNDVAAEAVQVMISEASSKGVAIQLDLEDNLPPLRGDQVQLQQVALNLLVNAMDALSHNQSSPKCITVQTAREIHNSVSLCVSDTGPGIDPDVMGRLFEPFFTTKPQGLGVGLSISRSIIESHGGHMGIASNTDKGARICCRLPGITDESPK
jgi:PAS domain S-box-containing protein